ncbi:MAG: laccase domain-containing protein [Flavonifractor plautii]
MCPVWHLRYFLRTVCPSLLYDPCAGAVAPVHAGWRGARPGIVTQAVEKMLDCYGTDPADLLAAIGPGISSVVLRPMAGVPNAMTEAMGASRPTASRCCPPANSGWI